MRLTAGNKYYKELNAEIRSAAAKEITVENVIGQRYLGTGIADKELILYGTPGNALAAYMHDCRIIVHGNVQDAVGDTMDDGEVVVYGHAGDTLGYGMRGGEIYIRGNAGYRVGIHMKAYLEKQPAIVIGGHAGSFLGEYQAGGTIVVLGLGTEAVFPTGTYLGTGMHGGAMYIRSQSQPTHLAPQVEAKLCQASDLGEIQAYLDNYARYFDVGMDEIMAASFYKITPKEGNPYHNLYTAH